jgi:hypothetical protein
MIINDLHIPARSTCSAQIGAAPYAPSARAGQQQQQQQQQQQHKHPSTVVKNWTAGLFRISTLHACLKQEQQPFPGVPCLQQLRE